MRPPSEAIVHTARRYLYPEMKPLGKHSCKAAVFRFAFHFSTPIERIIVFPMAISPNMWGLWNMLFVRLVRDRLPIGFWGAILPLVLAPMAPTVAGPLDISWITRIRIFAIGMPPAAIVYYLVWKHVVGFLNELLEID